MSNDTAWAEASALYGMLGEENMLEELRELIAVPPKIEQALRAFAYGLGSVLLGLTLEERGYLQYRRRRILPPINARIAARDM